MRPHNLTEQEFAELVRRKDRDPITVGGGLMGRMKSGVSQGRSTVPSPVSVPSPYRSKLEEAFAYRLVLEKRTGVIIDYWYEPTNLRLPGEKNFYKCDFLVLDANGLTFYEIKGKNKSDDRSLVKTKTAAGVHTWAKFVLVKRIKGQWEERVIA